MTPSAIEIGGLGLVVALLALAQRLGGFENRLVGRIVTIAAAGVFVVWCFLFLPVWVACIAALATWSACLWMVFQWLHVPTSKNVTSTPTFHVATKAAEDDAN